MFLQNGRTSFLVTLETGQLYVIAGMALGVVQLIDAELLRVLWLVGPEELYVAGGAVVILGLLELQDVVDLQVKPHSKAASLGSVLALVGHQLFCNGLRRLRSKLLLGELPGLRTLRWRTDYPFELVHTVHTRHSKVSKV